MDLKKRLANMDRLSRQNVAPSAGSRPQQKANATTLKKSLNCLQLISSQGQEEEIWTRDYTDDFSLSITELPSLVGFFTRAHEASPGLEDILFLDTETTGLSGGTGTIAFLVGVGWVRNNIFHSRQYFLPDFHHEHAMLNELASLAQKFEVVMTFNGASFDLPLLRTRALMNRLKDPCADLVSWDLLVPGRRLWGRIFPNCKQQTLEKGLLQMSRDSRDIEGALIPQTWFDFLQTAEPDLMGRVLHHNQRDLLGMAGIFAQVLDKAQCLHDNIPQETPWKEAWSLGRIAEIARIQEQAATWIQCAALANGKDSECRFLEARFVADAIRLLKRQGHWDDVEMIIKKALVAGQDEPWLHREAAILYEHRRAHLSKALLHARQCQEPGRILRLEKKILKIQEVKNGPTDTH